MIPHALCAWLLLSAAVATLDDYQYCAIRYRRLCQGKGRHVACQFPEAGPGLSCENYTEIRFTDELKHFVTHYINRRRQRLASGNERVRGGMHLPKPRIMMLVEWDRELAFLAQRLADQCHFVHDDCRATVRYPYAGQTVGEVRWRRLSDSDELCAQRGVRRVLDAWWGERRRVQPSQLTLPFRLTARGAVWGHFTQLAVWTLRAIGCGAVRHGVQKPRLLLVCDFSHTNMLGQRTISPGALAPCPMHSARRPRSQYPLLCGPVRRSEKISKQYDNYYDDDEIEDTVEAGEATSPKIEYVTHRKNIFATKLGANKDLKQAKLLAPTKALIIDKLEGELVRKKSEHKTYQTPRTDVTYREWTTRKKYFGKWRESHETLEETMQVEDTKPYSVLYQQSINTDFPRPTSFVRETPPRLRWKQTRDRPIRPGANALLNIQTPKDVALERRQSVVSLVLDKDDVDQLFKDTGFSMSWKKQVDQHSS